MLLEFSDDQLTLRAKVRAFAEAEITPIRRELETSPALYRQLTKKVAQFGLFQIVSFSEDGRSTSAPDAHVTLGMVCEELGRFDATLAQSVSGSGSRASRIGKLADADLSRTVRQGWLAGDLALVAGFSEASAGSDIRQLRTTARRVPGGVEITGEKNAITGLGDADWISILAKEVDEQGERVGFSQFFLPADAPGMTRRYLQDMGMRSRGRGVLTLDKVFVPDGQRIGEAGAGLKLMLGGFNYVRASQSLVCIGAAKATVEETVAYTSGRIAFGKPLAANQAVAFPLVEASTKLEAARWLCYRTLKLRDEGRDHANEAAMAKWWAPEVAIETIRLCLRLNGHIAYSNDLPIEQRLRDVLGFELADGASEIMKLILAREMFGREVVG